MSNENQTNKLVKVVRKQNTDEMGSKKVEKNFVRLFAFDCVQVPKVVFDHATERSHHEFPPISRDDPEGLVSETEGNTDVKENKKTRPLTALEAAEWMSVCLQTVQRLCRSGELEATRMGRLWRIQMSSIDAYMTKNKNIKSRRKRR